MKVFASLTCLLHAVALFYSFTFVRAQDSICARVKIEILQELTLERQAFEARMTINNGLQGIMLDGIGVDLLFSDRDGNAVKATTLASDLSAKFFWRLQTGSGIPASIAGGTSSRISWLIIPTPGAGGSRPQGELYFVGATLSYKVAGEVQKVQVSPDSITVKPMPLLALDYFLPREVYGDDPDTKNFVEPMVPFGLGVRVRNTGFGIASKVKIESAQPRIVENELGLAVDFRIDGSEVNGRPATPSLLADFGDIAAGRAGVGRWIMVSTLSGLFVEFTANYTHSDELGGQLTSLISGDPKTHFLLHDVLVDLPGRDSVRDFLALDGDLLRIYESDGADNDVQDQSKQAFVSGAGLTRIVSSGPTAGFSFIKLPDAFGGTQTLQSARRGDGKVILTANAWLSKTLDRNAKRWDYFVNVFDVNNVSGLSYTLQFGDGTTVANRAPRLDPISDWSLNPEETVGFPITASDPDGNTLTFSLAAPIPPGAALEPLSAQSSQFRWRPTLAQAATTNVFTVRVVDDGSPSKDASASFTVVVRPVNRPPIIADISNKVVDEESLLKFTVSAIDPDAPAQAILYSLAQGSPIGAQINATNGVFTWIPNEAQGPSTNVISIIATDNGIPSKQGTNTVRIVVNEVNQPPRLVAIPPQSGNVLSNLRVANRVIDPDIPANRLTFTLEPGSPSSARINPTNGLFSWTPQRSDNFSTNLVYIRVSDNGQPPYRDAGSFLIYVNDYLELTLGQSIVRIQETGRVSVTLVSRAGVTNLSFMVAMSTNHLAKPGIEALSASVDSATIEEVPPWLRVNLRARGGLAMQGTQELAALTFTTLSNRSDFVPIPLTNVTVKRVGGTAVPNILANDGRVIVLGPEPLLEAVVVAGKRRLVLYGNPGREYAIEQSESSTSFSWQDLNRYGLTNFSRTIDDIPNAGDFELYRARELAAGGPLMTIVLKDGEIAIEWPVENSGCTLLTSPSLTPPVQWTPVQVPVVTLGTRYRMSMLATNLSRFIKLDCTPRSGP